MKQVKKILCGVLIVCMILAVINVAPQTVRAANNDFVIENGILKEYRGTGKNITIPNSVLHIGQKAFYQCDTIVKVTIPKSVHSIQTDAFRNCKNLKSVKIAKGVSYISSGVFFNCENLDEISIPKSVDTIGAFAFGHTSWLEKKQKNSKNAMVVVNNILIDGEKCSGKISVPKSVRIIGANAFYGNENITEVAIPSSVKSIEGLSFYDCNNLSKIQMSKGLERIDWFAFENCENLKSVKIPSSVTFIGGYAFYGCKSIKSITLPKNVSNVARGAFGACDSLSKITILGKNTGLEKVTVGDDYGDIFYPDDNVENYAEYQAQLPQTLVIRGYKNSTAQKLAKNLAKKLYAPTNVKFEEI